VTEKIVLNVDEWGGKTVVLVETLTPEFLDKIKKDKDDKMGWKKYHKILKEKGYKIE